MRNKRIAVIGAGMGGLAAASTLAARGLEVVVLERNRAPGGKMREVDVGGSAVDGGPTVFTMRSVFDALFDDCGARFDTAVGLQAVRVLARHAWDDGSRLDLFTDPLESAQAIREFSGSAQAAKYLEFCQRAQQIHDTLKNGFLSAPTPSPFSLARQSVQDHGWAGFKQLWQLSPFETLWQALGTHFPDPRLRQLFGRYATYVGGSPFRTPATLMLVAHVEREGVWLVEGGMHRVAQAMANLVTRAGGRFRPNSEVREIEVKHNRVCGVRLTDGEALEVDAVVCAADVNAIASGRFGPSVRRAVAPIAPENRSLSAMTWTMKVQASGFPLLRHTVFFSDRYENEFDDIFRHHRLPASPTVYVCAQDRTDAEPIGVTQSASANGNATSPTAERLLCLVNAPAVGDGRGLDAQEVERCQQQTFERLSRHGLQLSSLATVRTTPREFEQMFPATGGALYGRAPHGWLSTFRRPGSRSRLEGLYLAGGSTHPGPGIAMSTQSGRLAAASVIEDLASIRKLHPVAMHGGMSTP
jgi:1-hydroxycarotenoid 3,4-desaturase